MVEREFLESYWYDEEHQTVFLIGLKGNLIEKATRTIRVAFIDD